jgi:hypothetical protein
VSVAWRSEGGEPLPPEADDDATWLERNLGSRAIGVLSVQRESREGEIEFDHRSS